MGKRPSDHARLTIRWQRRLRNARRRLYGGFAGALAWLLLRLPYRFTLGTISLLGRASLWLLFRRKARRNLERALPEMTATERRALVGRVFWHTSRVPAEALGLAKMGPEFFDRYVDDADASERLEQFEREWQGGWIGVTGHLGNWELLGQWLAHRTSRTHGGSVAKRVPNPYLNEVVERLRGRNGMHTLYRDDPPTKIIRMLRDSHCIGVVPDQDVPSLAGVFIDFLGQPAYTPVGPARLAVSAKVPLWVGAMLRDGDRFVLHACEPIFPDASRPKNEEIVRLTRAWSEQLEGFVRRQPEQWAWIHDRWKTTPERLEARQRRQLEL